MNDKRYVGMLLHEQKDCDEVHVEDVQRWGAWRRSMNKEIDTVGRVERPKRPCGKCITWTKKDIGPKSR